MVRLGLFPSVSRIMCNPIKTQTFDSTCHRFLFSNLSLQKTEASHNTLHPTTVTYINSPINLQSGRGDLPGRGVRQTLDSPTGKTLKPLVGIGREQCRRSQRDDWKFGTGRGRGLGKGPHSAGKNCIQIAEIGCQWRGTMMG